MYVIHQLLLDISNSSIKAHSHKFHFCQRHTCLNWRHESKRTTCLFPSQRGSPPWMHELFLNQGKMKWKNFISLEWKKYVNRISWCWPWSKYFYSILTDLKQVCLERKTKFFTFSILNSLILCENFKDLIKLRFE